MTDSELPDGERRTRSGQMRAIGAEIRALMGTLVTKFEAGGYNPTPALDLGALIAHADGAIDAEEMEALRMVLEPLLGAQLDPELVGDLIEASVDVIRQAGVEPRVRVIAEILLDCDAVEEGVLIALAVAFASQGLSPPERAVITQLARATRLEDDRLRALEARAKGF
ncbi:MAG: hypothetical protein NVSMB47_00860 [Polyangiales bacterium]